MLKNKFLLCLVLSSASITVIPDNQGWTNQSKEEVEYTNLKIEIAKINAYFSGLGCFYSSARRNAIFKLLKDTGTPVSYKILQELVASGDLPKSYLDKA